MTVQLFWKGAWVQCWLYKVLVRADLVMKSSEKVRLLIFSHNQLWLALWLPQSTLARGHSSSTFAAHRALWVVLCYNRFVKRNHCKCTREKNGRKCTRNPCKCKRERKWKKMYMKTLQIYEKKMEKYVKNPFKCTRRINEIVQETGSQSCAALGLPASARLFVAALLFSAKKWWECEFQQHSQTSRLVVPLLYKIQSTTNWRETLPGFRASCVKSRKFFSQQKWN